MLAPEKHVDEEDFAPFTTAPTRPKPTQLDPASTVLDSPISLEGAKTVGELVGRIARATRLSLLCDKRIAGRSVFVRGKGTVRAGTVLAALCRGVQGAVRRLDSTYVLTQQVQTHLELTEAIQVASEATNQPLEKRQQDESREAQQARGTLIRRRAVDNFPRDPRSQGPEALWKLGSKFHPPSASSLMDDDESEATPADPESVALVSLPDFFQQQAQMAYQKRLTEAQKLGAPLPTAPTRVSARVYLVAEALLPQLGARARITTFALDRLHPDTPLPEPLPPVTWPTTGVRGWYIPLPSTDSERDALISLAKRCKVSELRVLVPAGEEPEKQLTALAAQAKTANVKLVAAVRPWKRFSPRQSAMWICWGAP